MDNSPTLNEVLAALQAVMVIPAGTAPNTPTDTGLSIANGYTYNLPAENVYVPAQQDILNSNDPGVFPKMLFTIDGGNLALGASRRVNRTARLSLTIIIQEANLDIPVIADKPVGWRNVGDQVRDLVTDVQKIMLKNLSLGRLVERCVPADFETDSNFQYPNGVVVVWFNVEYMNQQ